MTTFALNNLWSYLQGLALARSDREWLAGKLLEPAAKEVENVATGKTYKVKPVSPDVERWNGCASFTSEEIDSDPRLKAIMSR